MHNVLDFEKIPFTKKRLFIPFLALITATSILSLAAILIKLAESDIGPSAIVFNRYWISAATLALWEVFQLVSHRESDQSLHPSIIPHSNDLILFAGNSLASFGCIFLWAVSLNQTSVANANLLHNMTPIFSTIGGWLFLNQKFDKRFLVGCGIALTASSCIEIEDWFISPDHLIGNILALASAALYAVAFLARESLRVKYSTRAILLWNCILNSILALGLTLILEEHLFPVTRSAWLSVIILGIVVQVLGHGLVIYSLKHFSSGFATTCLLLDPFITAVLAWIIFSERLTMLNMIAFVGVIVGIYLASIGKGSQKDAFLEDESLDPSGATPSARNQPESTP